MELPIYSGIIARLVLLPPSRNSDPGSHSRLSPLPTINMVRVRALRFHRETASALSSLVDSRRIVTIHPRYNGRSRQAVGVIGQMSHTYQVKGSSVINTYGVPGTW